MALMGLTNTAFAEALLQSDDFVGFSYWFITLGCLAATVFFFLERDSVSSSWKTPVTISGIITGIAFVHFMYMRNLWIQTGDAPVIYRYIEWFVTMPLLAVQFYLILSAVRKVTSTLFWKFFIAAVIMVSGGYAGEAGYIQPFFGLVIWMIAWIYILYELFPGDAGTIVSRSSNEDLVGLFATLKMIVTIGWMIYPLGYVFGYLTGGIDSNSLNVIYNFADFVNKIAFGVAIWFVAKEQ